ncbi:MAG: glycosyl hydrolase [Acidobacteriota bacterium]
MRTLSPRIAAVLVLALTLGTVTTAEQAKAEPKKDELMSSATFSGLKFRSLGPATKSGRIGDIAVDPGNPARYFVAVASGGVWRTDNAGTTWTPVFDKEGSYSIGCVTLDPRNPHTVWVGTGENNSQRSVSWGDGVYRSDDGGKTWRNMGLKKSEHIGMIAVDPRDSNVVYVAAQGPLWAPGGDRGLYKTTDGGATWNAVLTVSENTGISEVWLDPRDADVLYAVAYQRRRHVWTLINGGPESAIYTSTDAGKSWRKVTEGLPKVDLGRIGLAISPADPDVLYAVVEAAEDKSGVFRSTDRGASWEKRSDYKSTSGQYYNELFADPADVDRVYSMDTWLHVSEDGGATFKRVGERWKHVDNHAMWIDPTDTKHLRVGCDGGLYETWDRGATWEFKANLPVTQFYRVAVDDSKPFYFVYGGTQDNNTLGGPSRTTSVSGIHNMDWFVTTSGDGFVAAIDPTDPAIVYSESQHGGLVRYDRRSGEEIDIRPQEGKGEEPYRFNWDSPLLISPHASTRLYFAANKVFRSDDRGDTWKVVSPDLSRRIDRDRLPVMGKVWPADAVAKNASTSFYGNIVSLDESPKAEGLLYAGTDDGLVQVTEDGGANWRKVETFPGVPERTYVSDLTASLHDAGRVYAAFDNHKMGDFTPYLLRSTDRGRTWTSIAGDLPAGEVVYSIAEDHVDSDLLFAGCEFGVYFTVDGGRHWIELKGGLPTIAVRDIAVQRRENDLVLATFGRGFYVLDDYTPLRGLKRAALEADAALFPVEDAPAFVEAKPFGWRGKADFGDALYTAENPPFGATFTYYLKEAFKTRKELRHEAEKKAQEAGKTPPYPTLDELRAEAREEKPQVMLVVSDADGAVVRRIPAANEKGMQRVSWDLRFPPSLPAKPESEKAQKDPWDSPDLGPMAVPGTYSVSLVARAGGAVTPLAGPVRFEVVPLGLATLGAKDRAAVLAFQKKTARLQRAVLGAGEVVKETKDTLERITIALRDTPAASPALCGQARAIEARLLDLETALRGDREGARRNYPTYPSITGRVQGIVYAHWATTQAPTATMQRAYDIAADEFTETLASLRRLVEVDLAALEAAMEKAGAPHTPGRLPEWQKE